MCTTPLHNFFQQLENMDFKNLFYSYLASLIIVFSACQDKYFTAEAIPLSLVTDKEALISLKSQINMESSHPLSSWDVDSSPCNWTGVVCNENLERVTGLDLSGLGLEGTISPHIGNLSLLASIQLQNNRLTGTLPHQLSNLIHLRVLNASFNSIQGIIPPNISQCKNLMNLDLMQNEISGTIPPEISQLQRLQVLNLAGNHISGIIPSSISNISSLIILNLGTNILGGPLPSDLAKLRKLKQLDLTINNLTGLVPPPIYNMSSLVSLALASNNLWGDLPSDVGLTLPNLHVFNFCFNKFTGTIPGSLHNLTKIQVIRMAHNHLHGHVPPGLGNLPELLMYNIGFNRIVSSGDDGLNFLQSLTNSTKLIFLAIDYNLLEGVIPETIGNLSKALSKLYMAGNPIYGSIPSSIGQLSGLTLLNISYTSVSGEIPPEISQLKELQLLALAGNKLSGSIPYSLGNLRALNKIDLSENELIGSIPANFSNFQNLLSMDMSKNKLNGSIPKQLLNLPSLSAFLNLSHNLLSGPLPEEVDSLESVVTINLSYNRLSSQIPNSIHNCKSLEQLLLSHNMFSGQIPSTLGLVKGLETLDLSSNQLSGSIPFDLQKLQALQLLNLSFNNLDGEVPMNGVFANSSRVHLEGNKELCLQYVACKHTSTSHRRRLFFIFIIVAVTTILAVLLVVGLVFLYIKKKKAKVRNFPSKPFSWEHQMISYGELRQATSNFNEENQIGIGSFGCVYRGHIKEGITVAVKVIDTGIRGSWKSFMTECAALKHLRHRNLVKLITMCSSFDFQNREFLALIYEFMSNGSLQDWLTGKRKSSNGGGLDIFQRLNIAIDVAHAICYLHHESETPVVHCDLKPGNILLDADMTAKVGDFGIAKLMMETNGDTITSISSSHALKGSIGYIPPEYGLGEKVTIAGDVYSYGILLLELFTGKSPIDDSLKAGLSLKNWVEMSFPDKIEEVLDRELLSCMNNFGQEDHFVNTGIQVDCLISIIEVGLSCAVESPSERMTIKNALDKLRSAKEILLKSTI
ncbi:putative receptor-like protein kinase At3g47110 [Lycium ferocissimum]|uniref:putative receptor-like protein kinase At3g47110 n=1 Tax=Lycium ferocissimum TaxID=112874 RepID=UPI0028160AF4|nr:putative receptor-like protein kinase At3g47110 [Lycium ferocissimum]